MPIYRVFTTRHYIAVEYFDIEATSPARASRLATIAAEKLYPDVRSRATDNHWHADPPVVEIPHLGYNWSQPCPTQLVFENKYGKAYQDKESEKCSNA